MDFRVVDDKVIVKARVNGGRPQDFVLDTGSELTTISRQTASSAVVRPITYTLSAGVGEVGLRGLQLGRLDTLEIGTLKVSNVPALIKAPALRGIPKRETESFSPLGLGLSMTIDYATHKLSLGRKLPEEPAEFTLPMRHHRLSMVRGLLNDKRPTYFVVDTGGEVISISTATAEELDHDMPRKIALRVYGTSGWDRDAFLMPGVNLRFNQINYNNFAVVVLNLQAPSVLLGFQVGGIVGHKFLSPYRVTLDMERSQLRMSKAVAAELARPCDSGVPRGVTSRPALAGQPRICSRHRSSSSGVPAQRRHRFGLAVVVQRHEGQVGVAGQLALTGLNLFREDLDFHFQRRLEHAGHARLEDDQVADLDRMDEVERVDARREGERVGVAVTGDGAGDVDQMHHRAAENEAERIGVVRQDDLDRLGRGVLPTFCFHGS